MDGLLPCLGCCKECCCEHRGVSFQSKVFSGYRPGVGCWIHAVTVFGSPRGLHQRPFPPTGRRAPAPAPSPALSHAVLRSHVIALSSPRPRARPLSSRVCRMRVLEARAHREPRRPAVPAGAGGPAFVSSLTAPGAVGGWVREDLPSKAPALTCWGLPAVSAPASSLLSAPGSHRTAGTTRLSVQKEKDTQRRRGSRAIH